MAASAAPRPRVLLADDSAVVRQVVRDLLEADGIEVVGEARTGREAVAQAIERGPDLVILDIHMPQGTGVEAVALIMGARPSRVLILSNVAREGEVGMCLEALRAGALEVMAKPVDLSAVTRPLFGRELVSRVRLLCGVRLPALGRPRLRSVRSGPTPPLGVAVAPRPAFAPGGRCSLRCVAVGASTGGPRVLSQLLRELPGDFPAGLLIVQHIAAGFAPGLARWLGEGAALDVRLAREGDRIEAGRALVAPSGQHLVLRQGRVALLDEAPVHGCRPSVDVLFESVAYTFRGSALGVILSGMGQDGVAGAQALKQQGAVILAQTPESCAIYGMPKGVVDLGLVDRLVAPEELAGELLRRAGRLPAPAPR